MRRRADQKTPFQWLRSGSSGPFMYDCARFLQSDLQNCSKSLILFSTTQQWYGYHWIFWCFKVMRMTWKYFFWCSKYLSLNFEERCDKLTTVVRKGPFILSLFSARLLTVTEKFRSLIGWLTHSTNRQSEFFQSQ